MPDVLEGFTSHAVAQPADQQGNISALTASVCMKFIHYQKPQTSRRFNQLSFIRSGEDEFGHYIVRNKDVRRVRDYRLALLVLLLAGVLRKLHRRSAFGIPVVKELLQFAELAVGEGIHRVDDQGLDASPRTSSQDLIDDRNDIGKALTGCGAGRQNVVASLNCPTNRIGLMAVQMKRPPGIIAAGSLVLAENPAAFLMEDALRHQAVHRIARLKDRIQLNQRIWPQQSGVQFLLNPLVDLPVTDLYEASDVRRVVIDQLPPNFESVHNVALANGISWASTGWIEAHTRRSRFDRHTVL